MSYEKNGVIQYNYKITGKSGIVHCFNAYINDGFHKYLVKKVEHLDHIEYIKVLGEHIDVELPVIVIASSLSENVYQLIKDYENILVIEEEKIKEINFLDIINRITK